MIVRFRQSADGVTEQQRAEFDANADEVESVGRRGARRMRSGQRRTAEMLQALRANPDIEYAEPNYILRVSAPPNEPWLPNLWAFNNTGQSINGSAGTTGADINALEAWQVTVGNREHVIGVIDTGIDYNHPDLVGNLWAAPRPFSVTIGGVTINCAAGTRGFNAINNTCDPFDDHSHGTHVAGTIGATGNNGSGVVGVNWIASMMGLKFLSASGSGTTTDAIKAIEFAIQAKAVLGADANVRILSNSWGGGGFSTALKNQIDAANAADMLFVAAAGNDSSNNDSSPQYPANYSSANIISVASTTNRDARSSFSNWGATTVHLGAPGSAILSTVPGNSYAYYNGTSMATPQVSGAAALMLATCPRTTAELKAALLANVDPIASMQGITRTGGRLNVDRAVRSCLDPAPALSASYSAGTLTATLSNGPGNPKDWVALFCRETNGDNDSRAWKYLNGTTTPPGTGSKSGSVNFTVDPSWGSCNVRLFLNNTTTKIATSSTVSLTSAALTVNTPNVTAGAPISVSVADGPGNPSDWVALFPSGAGDQQYVQWKYLNGQQAVTSGQASATVTFTAPATPGTYNVRMFASNGFTRLATSSAISVTAPPTLAINDVTVTEGNSGTATATFTVTLNPANASQSVTVNYATANGTAGAGTDYTAASGTLTFSPTVTARSVSVAVSGDAVVEADETFVVNLSGAANAVIGDAQGVATIANDDVPPPPTLTFGSATASPGSTVTVTVGNGPGNRADWLALHAASANDKTYTQWKYLDGSQVVPATGSSSAVVTFVAPDTPGTYNVRMFADNGFTRLATSGVLTVAVQPTLSINDVSVAEGQSGTTTASFTVTVNPVNSSQSVTVNYATANGTATAGSDYTAASGTLTFTPSTSTQTIAVPVAGDATIESNETFVVNLSGAANAAIGDGQGIGTIANDDVPPPPSLTLGSSSVPPGGTFTVTIAGGPGNRADWIALHEVSAADKSMLQWKYLDGTQTAPASGSSGATVTFTAPATPGSYNVRLFADNGFSRLATSGTLSVVVQPTLSINDITITEGQSGTATGMFTVTLTPPNTGQSVTVNYATANATATAGVDYAAASGTLTFGPSVSTQQITVVVSGDATVEPNETFVVNLSAASNAVIGDGQGVATIGNDDSPAAPALALSSGSANPGDTIQVSLTNGPGSSTDWIGLYAVGSNDKAIVAWKYLNNSQTAPGAGLNTANLTFPAPAQPGQYHFRLLASNGFTVLATSSPLSVSTSGASSPTGPTCRGSAECILFAKGGETADLYVMRADGTDVTRVTTSALGSYGAAWSSDGTKIAFSTRVTVDGNPQIFVMNADGSNRVRLTTGNLWDADPSWSPDGSRIAFTRILRVSGNDNPDVFVMNADGSGQTRLTTASGTDRDPVWSPDGSHIAFMSHRDGNAEIYLMAHDGSDLRRLTHDPRDERAPTWSPDGTRLAFHTDGFPEQIFSIAVDGGVRTQLTASASYEPSWSADGLRIVYISGDNREIKVMNSDGSSSTSIGSGAARPRWRPRLATSTPQPLPPRPAAPSAFGKTTPTDGAQNQLTQVSLNWAAASGALGYEYCLDTSVNNVCNTAWVAAGNATVAITPVLGDGVYQWQVRATNAGGSTSADLGAWRTFTVSPPAVALPCGANDSCLMVEAGEQVLIVDPDGRGSVQVTTQAGGSRPGAWSPDGNQLVFSSMRDGLRKQLYTANADGTNPRRLLASNYDDYYPDWSPDGSKVVFVRGSNGVAQIFVVGIGGTGETRLTNTAATNTRPVWSPDGARIAFVSYRDGNGEIYTMAANGSDVRRVTNDPIDEGYPSWSPDGTRLMFSKDNGEESIFVVNADGTNRIALFRGYDAAWSPDGTMIAYSCGTSLCVANVDGTNQRSIGAGRWPRWRPLR